MIRHSSDVILTGFLGPRVLQRSSCHLDTPRVTHHGRELCGEGRSEVPIAEIVGRLGLMGAGCLHHGTHEGVLELLQWYAAETAMVAVEFIAAELIRGISYRPDEADVYEHAQAMLGAEKWRALPDRRQPREGRYELREPSGAWRAYWLVRSIHSIRENQRRLAGEWAWQMVSLKPGERLRVWKILEQQFALAE